MSLLHAEKFRRIGRNAGERVQWLRAVEGAQGPNGEQPNAQGKYFVEMYLPDEVRVRIYTNYSTVKNEEFGEIKVAQTRLRWMPDELQPRRDDRFICLDRVREDGRCVLQPEDEQYRSLNGRYAVSISAIHAAGRRLLQSSYSLENGRLRWMSVPPDEPVTVLCSYTQAFEMLGEDVKQGPLDRLGVRLPSWASLRELSAGEE